MNHRQVEITMAALGFRKPDYGAQGSQALRPAALAPQPSSSVVPQASGQQVTARSLIAPSTDQSVVDWDATIAKVNAELPAHAIIPGDR